MQPSRRTTIWLFCVTSIVATTGFVQNSAQTGNDVRNLYTYLFTTSGYNKDVRPAQNQSAPTSVSVQLLLTGFLGLQETSQQLNTVGILHDYTVEGRLPFLDTCFLWRGDLHRCSPRARVETGPASAKQSE